MQGTSVSRKYKGSVVTAASAVVGTLMWALLFLAGSEASHSAGSVANDTERAGPGAAVSLIFQEQEAGVAPYTVRYIVTDRHLRIDDGVGAQDFVLLDRLRGTVYSTNSEDRTVLAIERRPRDVEPPIELVLEESAEPLAQAPSIAGRRAQRHVFRVNGRRCYDVVAVPGLLEGAVAALREYRLVLASEHKRMLPHVPADMQEPCDLAHNVFSPARHLAHGLPVQEWARNGLRRSLVDFDTEFSADPGLFVLPEGFRMYTLETWSGQPQ